jgi:tetratricopeptide repeat protein 8
LDAGHVEAIASLAASHFYQGEAELGLRYYRRLLQMGAGSKAEVGGGGTFVYTCL